MPATLLYQLHHACAHGTWVLIRLLQLVLLQQLQLLNVS
jgi:hypothetical protein